MKVVPGQERKVSRPRFRHLVSISLDLSVNGNYKCMINTLKRSQTFEMDTFLTNFNEKFAPFGDLFD